MRTLALFAQSFFPSPENYLVAATLSFEIVQQDKSQAEILRFAIMDIDSRFPWVDIDGFGDKVRSIGWLSTGEIVRSGLCHDKMRWSFNLETKKQWMRKGQLLAYEKYLEKIVSELSKQSLPGIGKVWATMATRKEISAVK